MQSGFDAILKNLRLYRQNPNSLTRHQREACRQFLLLLQRSLPHGDHSLNELKDEELAALLDQAAQDPIVPPLLAAITGEVKQPASKRKARGKKKSLGADGNPAISIHAEGNAYAVQGDMIQADGPVFKGNRQRHTHVYHDQNSHMRGFGEHAVSPSSHMDWTFLNLSLSRGVGGAPQNLAIRQESNISRSHYTSTLPFSQDQAAALNKLLEHNHEDTAIYRFSMPECASLEKLLLMETGLIFPREHQLKRIGGLLFNCLFPDLARKTELKDLIRLAAAQEKPLMMQLEFDPNDTLPASLPWELIHDGRCHLLLEQKVAISRTLAVAHPPRIFECASPYRIAVMSARPTSAESDAPETHLGTETEATLLSELLPEKSFQILPIPYGTLDSLKNTLDTQVRIHIFHGDGHAELRWRCDGCGQIWPRGVPKLCQTCDTATANAQPTGVLSIRALNGTEQYLDARGLGVLLARKGIRLVCLSACHSGVVAPNAMYAGFAQYLMREGIPAVLGMQLIVGQSQAARFFEAFYKALAGGRDLRLAVAHARAIIFDGDAWYRPVLYLHCAEQHKRLIHFPNHKSSSDRNFDPPLTKAHFWCFFSALFFFIPEFLHWEWVSRPNGCWAGLS